MVKKLKVPVKKVASALKKTAVKAVKKPVKLNTVPALKIKAGKVPRVFAVEAPKAVMVKAAMSVSDDKLFGLIQNKAYELFIARGCSAGSDLGDWYRAEQLVKKELGAKGAA